MSAPLSVFDMFKVGIGPSSSHTVGPMRAALRFAERVRDGGVLDRVARVRVELFGSLGHTGKGHGTDRAVILGLGGERPDAIDPDSIDPIVERVSTERRLSLLSASPAGGASTIDFDPASDIVFHKLRRLPRHPNGMTFVALDGEGGELVRGSYYSVGGGFVVDEGQDEVTGSQTGTVPHGFRSGAELLDRCATTGLSVSTLVRQNELTWRSAAELDAGLLRLWSVMQACVTRGCAREGILPGGLKLRRRAAALHRKLRADPRATDPMVVLDWVDLWALAVNEENAAGGRVVTAPTNGAAGIVPAVAHYYVRFCPGADDDGVLRLLLAAGAIGILYATNASISGAEVGCQGEVGVACSMAAAGLCDALGGTPPQVENAAEIGMEHNLGLTCDPIGGLVQVPCIERNAMGAVKAINAARLAMQGDGTHRVSLDKVIATMRRTGADMNDRYKETSRGGLAVNVIEC